MMRYCPIHGWLKTSGAEEDEYCEECGNPLTLPGRECMTWRELAKKLFYAFGDVKDDIAWESVLEVLLNLMERRTTNGYVSYDAEDIEPAVIARALLRVAVLDQSQSIERYAKQWLDNIRQLDAEKERLLKIFLWEEKNG